MDPIHSPEELFGNLMYDYLNKKGLSRTAETFLEETQLAAQIPANFDQHPHGFLYDLWTTFCEKYNSRQLIPGNLIYQNQVSNIGSIMETTSQMLREDYSIQSHSSFPRGCRWTALSSCDFSSDGKFVASGGLGGGKPFICNLETRTSVIASESHSLSIYEVRFQPQSTIFATSANSKTVKLWNADGLVTSVFEFVGHNGIVRSLDFHPSGEILCSSDTDDVIKVWDPNRHILINEFKQGGSKVRFQPICGLNLAVTNKNVIDILDFRQNLTVLKSLRGHVKDICSICWDVTGCWIASASEDDVRVWSLVMDEPYIYECPSKGKKIKSIIFHPRYHNVLVVGSSRGIDLLRIEVGGLLHMKPVSDLPTTGLAACMQNELIASTSTSNGQLLCNRSVVNIWK